MWGGEKMCVCLCMCARERICIRIETRLILDFCWFPYWQESETKEWNLTLGQLLYYLSLIYVHMFINNRFIHCILVFTNCICFYRRVLVPWLWSKEKDQKKAWYGPSQKNWPWKEKYKLIFLWTGKFWEGTLRGKVWVHAEADILLSASQWALLPVCRNNEESRKTFQTWALCSWRC